MGCMPARTAAHAPVEMPAMTPDDKLLPLGGGGITIGGGKAV